MISNTPNDDQIVRFLFLDTEFFISNNFDYKNDDFLNLSRLNNRFAFCITDIVLQEVQSHIRSEVKVSGEHLAIFRSKAKILRNCKRNDFSVLFNKFSKDFIENELLRQFNQAIEQLRVIIIPTHTVNINEIFHSYFLVKPPFEENNKKKYEFPDAFTLAALTDWCKSKNERMYVISQDKGVISYCTTSKYLIHLENIDKLFEHYTLNEFQVPDKIKFRLESDNFIIEKLDLIQKKVIERFQECGFIVVDVDGSVGEVSVEQIELIDKSLVEITSTQIIYKCIFSIDFNAEIHFQDPETPGLSRLGLGEMVTKTIEDNTEIKVKVIITRKNADDFLTQDFSIELDQKDDFIVNANIYE